MSNVPRLKRVASPAATGGAGVEFEKRVAATYLVSLLTRSAIRGLGAAQTEEVRFQRLFDGEPMDDIVAVGTLPTGKVKLALQAKRDLVFGEKDETFQEVISACWQTFTSPGFTYPSDRFGIAIGLYSKKVDEHYQQVLNWAFTSASADDFFKRIGTKRLSNDTQRGFVELIRTTVDVTSGTQISDEQLWQFLRSMVILYFDFQGEGSGEQYYATETLRHALPLNQQGRAPELFGKLVEYAATGHITAGSFSLKTLRERLQSDGFALTSTQQGTQIAEALELLKSSGVVRFDAVMGIDAAVPPLTPGASDVITRAYLDRYEPIREHIESWRLVEAEAELRAFVTQVDEAARTSPDVGDVLRDFRQRIRFALANVLHWRDQSDEGKQIWWEARVLGPLSPERARQAGAVLANLDERSELMRFCAEETLDPGDRVKLLAISHWQQGNPEAALTLIPEQTEDPDLINLRVRVRTRLATESSLPDLLQEMETAWGLNRGSPHGMLSIAELTDQILRRIVEEGWVAEKVDRRPLLDEIRWRYGEAVATAKQLEVGFPQALLRALSSKLTFHVYLDEREEAEQCRSRLESLPVSSRARAIAELLSEQEPEGLQTIQEWSEAGHITDVERAVLESRYLAHSASADQAEAVLRAAVQDADDAQEREAVLGELIRLLSTNDRITEAEDVLVREPNIPAEFAVLMRAMMALNVQGRAGAISALRASLAQFPKSRLILQNLVRLLIAEVSGRDDGADATETAHDLVLEEAQKHAKQLAEILPSPEAEILLGILAHDQGAYEEALAIFEGIEARGYQTPRSISWKSKVLLALERAREAANELERALELYPADTSLVELCAAAWIAGENFDRSIALLEPLSASADASPSTLANLGLALMLRSPNDVDAAMRAFKLLKRAFELNPTEPTLPARIVEAGQASGQTEEAMALVGSVDLTDNPYLWSMPTAEAIEWYREATDRLQLFERLYRGGLLPFAVYAENSPRSAWYLWLARISAWRARTSLQRAFPLLVDLPTIASEWEQSGTLGAGMLLDMTSIITLGSLGLLDDVIRALAAAGCSVYLFPGYAKWIREELLSLRGAQLPWYRGRYVDLKKRLESTRRSADIVEDWPQDAPPIEGEVLGAFGPGAVDYQLSRTMNALYVDDYVGRREDGNEVTEGVTTSGELLRYFGRQGLLFRDQVQGAETDNAEPFGRPDRQPLTAIPEAVLLSEQALLAWYEAGLLAAWLDGREDWPKLVVGPWAWGSLLARTVEAELYSEALERAQRTHDVLSDALDAGRALECRPVDGEVTEDGQLAQLWRRGLSVLAAAGPDGLTVCADDLFLRLAVGRFGFLADDSGFRVVEETLRARHQNVRLVGTVDLLRRLNEAGAISEMRYLEAAWMLWEGGYRVMRLGGVLRRLLRQVPYQPGNLTPPYQRLLQDITGISEVIPQDVGQLRRAAFGRLASVAVATDLIAEVWLESPEVISTEQRVDLAAQIVSAYEKGAITDAPA